MSIPVRLYIGAVIIAILLGMVGLSLFRIVDGLQNSIIRRPLSFEPVGRLGDRIVFVSPDFYGRSVDADEYAKLIKGENRIYIDHPSGGISFNLQDKLRTALVALLALLVSLVCLTGGFIKFSRQAAKSGQDEAGMG